MPMIIDRDKLYAEIGRRVKAAREAQRPKLTQGELAKKLGVERTSITNIEKGIQRATLHFLYSLVQQLELPLQRLFPTLDDERIIKSGEITGVAETKVGEGMKTVPNEVKLFYEKL